MVVGNAADIATKGSTMTEQHRVGRTSPARVAVVGRSAGMADDERMVRVDFFTVPAVADDVTLQGHILSVADGFTISRGTGGWFDSAARRVVVEDSATVTVVAPFWSVGILTDGFDEARVRAGESVVLRTISEVFGVMEVSS